MKLPGTDVIRRNLHRLEFRSVISTIPSRTTVAYYNATLIRKEREDRHGHYITHLDRSTHNCCDDDEDGQAETTDVVDAAIPRRAFSFE